MSTHDKKDTVLMQRGKKRNRDQGKRGNKVVMGIKVPTFVWRKSSVRSCPVRPFFWRRWSIKLWEKWSSALRFFSLSLCQTRIKPEKFGYWKQSFIRVQWKIVRCSHVSADGKRSRCETAKNNTFIEHTKHCLWNTWWGLKPCHQHRGLWCCHWVVGAYLCADKLIQGDRQVVRIPALPRNVGNWITVLGTGQRGQLPWIR